MGDPYVREVGRVAGIDGEPVTVGVDYDTVALRVADGPGGAPARLAADSAEEFAQMYVAACWQAGQNKRQMAEEIHEADGGDSMECCDAEDAGYICTETGPHRIHLARVIVDGDLSPIMHAWDAVP